MAERASGAGGGGWALPWPAVVGVIIAAGGALFYFSPLNTSRPQASGTFHAESIGYQDVEARLWQDPFKAVADRRAKLQASAQPSAEAAPPFWKQWPLHRSPQPLTSGPQHRLADLHQQMEQWQKQHPGETLLILPVMVPGGPYAELAEQRMRTRVAVLEALAKAHFPPDDGEHIGYIDVPWDWRPMVVPVQSTNSSQPYTRVDIDLQNEPSRGMQLPIPYEWCNITELRAATAIRAPTTRGSRQANNVLPRASSTRAADGNATQPVTPSLPANGQNSAVIVLWLNEDAFADAPLRRLAGLIGKIRSGPQWPVRIIGPHTSTTLRAMLDEACRGSDDQAFQRDCGALGKDANVAMYCASATAEDGILLNHLPFAKAGDHLDEVLARTIPFVRTTVTDGELSETLVQELALRGIHVSAPGGEPVSSSAPANKPDDIAIVAEWDTFYGRALPISFIAHAKKQSVWDLVGDSGAKATLPEWIHTFTYLRGIDGRSPGDDTKSSSDKNSGKSAGGQSGGANQAAARPADAPEASEGTDQSDYLRRLADQLSRLDDALRKGGGKGLRAVGVLGTDVYDTLLVLRALRDRLHGVVFFTAGLDARYALPSERKAAHNLVIASPFGLRLNDYYQKGAAPFRDTYQTATFAATLAAIGEIQSKQHGTQRPQEAMNDLLRAPRIFEIGHNHLYDLTVDDPVVLTTPETGPYADSAGATAALHPPRYDLGPWFGAPADWAPLIALSLLTILAVPVLAGVRPEQIQRHKLFTTTSAFIVLAVLLAGVLVAWIVRLQGAGGEPFAWFDGVSIWPTIAFRLVIIALAIHYIVKGLFDSKDSDEELQRHFRLKPLSEATPGGAPPDALPQNAAPYAMLNKWRVFGRVVETPGAPGQPPAVSVQPVIDPTRATLRASGISVFAQNLWWEYKRRACLRSRLIRILPMVAAYCILGIAVVNFFGAPNAPARGWSSQWWDAFSLWLMILTSTLLNFFVLDGTYLNKRFIEYLGKTRTYWPNGAFEDFAEGIDFHALTELMDIRFIAMRTRTVGAVIYFPFVIFFLTILSRNPFFDDWSWPVGLVLILGLNMALAIIAALMLRGVAEEARVHALDAIDQRLITAKACGKSNEAAVLQSVRDRVAHEREGAFSILSQYPFIAAILLPSGGIGLALLLEYLPKILTG